MNKVDINYREQIRKQMSIREILSVILTKRLELNCNEKKEASNVKLSISEHGFHN